ncbi:MAG: hypothetical protein CMB99_00880 [Flavobacteriaceae bacterium]|nr:hypothetical protein [Flavobacteriaceae bacterium]
MPLNKVVTRRFTVTLKELTLEAGMELASFSPDIEHQSTTRFLESIIESAEGDVVDIGDWTIQERTMVKAMYLASTLETGPDFAISSSGGGEPDARLSDYLSTEDEYTKDSVTIDKYVVIPITGRVAESLERIQGEVATSEYGFWLLGAIAASVCEPGESLPDNASELDDELLKRISDIVSRPQSEVNALMEVLATGQHQLYHLLNMVIAQIGGFAVRPKEAESDKPLTRFPVSSALSERTALMAGKLATAGA